MAHFSESLLYSQLISLFISVLYVYFVVFLVARKPVSLELLSQWFIVGATQDDVGGGLLWGWYLLAIFNLEMGCAQHASLREVLECVSNAFTYYDIDVLVSKYFLFFMSNLIFIFFYWRRLRKIRNLRKFWSLFFCKIRHWRKLFPSFGNGFHTFLFLLLNLVILRSFLWRQQYNFHIPLHFARLRVQNLIEIHTFFIFLYLLHFLLIFGQKVICCWNHLFAFNHYRFIFVINKLIKFGFRLNNRNWHFIKTLFYLFDFHSAL